MKLRRIITLLAVGALLCTGCRRPIEKAPGVSDEAYDLIQCVLDTAYHYTALDKAMAAYQDTEGTAPLKEGASLETLNAMAQVYGMPADKQIKDCEYVDLTKSMTDDEILGLDAWYLGPCAAYENNVHVATTYGAGITRYTAAGTLEIKCTPTPPEIYDYIKIDVIEKGVTHKPDENAVLVGADVCITNTGWTKGIPAVSFTCAVYNEEDEVVASATLSLRELYVPDGASIRTPIRTQLRCCSVSSDMSLDDVNMNGLYAMFYPCVGIAAGANDYAGTLTSTEDYRITPIIEEGAIRKVAIENTSDTTIQFNRLYLTVYDECSGYTWQYMNDEMKSQPMVEIAPDTTYEYELGVSRHSLYMECFTDSDDYGIAFKGIDMATHDDIKLTSALLNAVE